MEAWESGKEGVSTPIQDPHKNLSDYGAKPYLRSLLVRKDEVGLYRPQLPLAPSPAGCAPS